MTKFRDHKAKLRRQSPLWEQNVCVETERERDEHEYSNTYLTRCNATQFILSGNCSTCFRWDHHPSSGAQTTVSTASGICHTVIAICRYRGRVETGLSVLWVAYAITVWQIPDAVDRVLCAPDDGWWYHPKHVEQFLDKINCVTLHLVGYILEYYYDARTHER